MVRIRTACGQRVRKYAKSQSDSLIVPYTPYGQGAALNGTKSPVKLKTLNVGKFPNSMRTPERKAEQHKGMRQIDLLQTDPPRWPQEIKTSFERHLFGVLYNLRK